MIPPSDRGQLPAAEGSPSLLSLLDGSADGLLVRIRDYAHFYVALLLTVLLTVLASISSSFGLLMPRALGRRWMLAHPALWARAILFLAACPVVITRKAPLPPGGFLVFANHQSMLDILAVFVAMKDTPVAFAAKRELFKIPFLGWYLSFAGFIEVDRSNRRRAMRAYEKACVLIRDEGVRVAIYPEGTRSIDGSILPFKRGAFVLAIQSQAPIVPVAVEGAQKAARKHTVRLRGHPIRVVIGAPIPTAGLTVDDREALLVRTRTEILALHLEAGAEPSPVEPMAAKPGKPSGEREEP